MNDVERSLRQPWWLDIKLWELWWCRSVHPHALALFRIFFGVFLCGWWACRLPHITELFTQHGLTVPLTTYIFPPLLHGQLSPPSPGIALTLYIILLLCIVLLMCGYHTRKATAGTLLLYAYFEQMVVLTSSPSLSVLCVFFLCVLLFSDAENAFSVAMKKRHGSFLAWEYASSILPQRLLSIQVAAIYLFAGIQTLWLPGWQGGEIFWYAFIGAWGTPVSYSVAKLGWSLTAYRWLVLGVKAFEIVFPIGVWIRGARIWFFVLGILAHAFFIIFLSLWWSLVLVIGYILFFSPEEVYEKLVQWTRGRISAF